MAQITWAQIGERRFETGVDRGVLFPAGGVGVAWSGLTAVTESPSGGEPNAYYADGVKYMNSPSTEEFNGSIEAYTYPEEFSACDGSRAIRPGLNIGQQRRTPFGLSYRTRLGNDLRGTDFGYKLHIVYNAIASPSEKAYNTVSDDPEAITFSWDFTTTPIYVAPGYKPTAHIAINSTRISKSVLTAIENQIYGTSSTIPTLPTPAQLLEYFSGVVVADEYGIEFNGVTGLSPLVFGAGGDLIPSETPGLWVFGSASRLVDAGQPGLYILEE